jgi:prepilin-type N-terminal cleavage/methylation domain-containing protein
VVTVAKGDAGFTMVEVIVSLAIFAGFSAAALAAIIGSSKAQDATRSRVSGTNIAQSDLEQARALPSPSAANYTTSAPGDTATYRVARTVTYPTPSCTAGGLIKISVVVSQSGSSTQVRTDTVVACP